MCRFFSCIVTSQSDILWHPSTDAHEDLIAHFKLNDSKVGQFVRVEFTAEAQDLGDIDKYVLNVDESVTPEWFEPMRDSVTERLRAIVSPMIVSDERQIILGGPWVFCKKAHIHAMRNGRVIVMLDSSQVGVMLDSSQVGEMWGSSQVGEMLDSSQVGEMLDSSQVGKMLDSSQVGKMWGSSQVGKMWGSSQVGKMLDSSQVGEMLDSSQVGKMWDSSRIATDNRVKN